ncbi:MAG: hypothetical protein R6V14_06565, partial [Halanaerobiales bacterium]
KEMVILSYLTLRTNYILPEMKTTRDLIRCFKVFHLKGDLRIIRANIFSVLLTLNRGEKSSNG